MEGGKDGLSRLYTGPVADEHDSCALIANVRKTAVPSHGNVKRTLEALVRMGHRTGEVDGEGDGCGVLTDIPRHLWAGYLEAEGYPGELAEASRFFVGHILIPAVHRQRGTELQQRMLEIMTAEGCSVLISRPGITRGSALGKLGRRDEPLFWQVAGVLRLGNPHDVESHLFSIQLRLESALPVHVASLSSHSVVYKVRGSVETLGRYYPELRNPDYRSAITIGHSRYSTNTLSVFERVQPFTVLAHNGEINTINKLCQEARLLGVTLIPGASDSQHVNRILQSLICQHGLTLVEAMELLWPPVPHAVSLLPPAVRAVYHRIRNTFGPFAQGPAAIIARWQNECVFSVDALGLRPLWFGATEKEYFVSSEKGVVPLEEMVCDPRPLAPGEKLAIRLRGHEGVDVLDYAQIQDEMARSAADWEEQGAASAPHRRQFVMPVRRREAWAGEQRILAALGWGHSHVDYVQYLAQTGSEPLGSLGHDGPLAALDTQQRNLADYFKESVAVVTNPAIDREREGEQFSTETLVGPRPPVGRRVGTSSVGNLVRLETPLLLDGGWDSGPDDDQVRSVAERHGTALWDDLLAHWDDGGVLHLPTSYSAQETVEAALQRLGQQAVDGVMAGASVIALDDASVLAADRLWLDPLLALAAVDRALRQAPAQTNLRRQAGIVLRSGALRNLHDLMLAVGLGADAVCPYLLWQVGAQPGVGQTCMAPETRLENVLTALTKGMEKVASTMGIHELRGYGRVFSSIGLATPLAAFLETVNYCGSEQRGLTWARLEADARERARVLAGEGPAALARIRHFYASVWKTAAAVSQGEADWRALAAALEEQERVQPVALRHVMGFATTPAAGLSPQMVDTRVGIHSFPIVISAMSFGSQGETAFRAYVEAAKRTNIVCMNGEGGEIGDLLGRYPLHRGQQVASGRFGVNAALLNSAYVIEIKIGQGAKPGEGGHLPGKKVSPKVAAARHATPGVDLISPSNNHDLYSIEDLAQLVEELKTAHPRARVAVKVPVVPGIGIIAVGIAKAGADIINLSGYDGGTGAARAHALQYVGLPAEIGVVDAHHALTAAGLRKRVEIWCDGGMKGPADVLKMICLGANRVGFGTMAMIAIGCVVCRSCHTDTCPRGIACQLETVEEASRRGVRHFSPRSYDDSVERLCRFLSAVGEGVRHLTAALGATRTQDLVGRSDLLRQERHLEELDLTALLTPVSQDVAPPPYTHRIIRLPRNYLTKAISSLVIEVANEGDRNISFFDDRLGAEDRALGTHLAGEMVRALDRHAVGTKADGGQASSLTVPVDRVTLNFNSGSIPGNGLGAFATDPVHIVVEGGAQDGVAKGALGGTVVILKGMNHVGRRLDGAVGKSFAYGAQSGLLIVQGDADSRACVRLSGADVVFGGEITAPLDDSRGLIGCRANLKGFAFEYMTAGRVLVLGDPGPWICAGMTGGIVYVRLNRAMGFDVAALRRRIARGARVEICRPDQRAGEDICYLLDAYCNALRENDQVAEAERISAYATTWATDFVCIVPAAQLVDQELVTE